MPHFSVINEFWLKVADFLGLVFKRRPTLDVCVIFQKSWLIRFPVWWLQTSGRDCQ